MSIKELRALDAAIHKLLGDDEREETQKVLVADETEAESNLLDEEFLIGTWSCPFIFNGNESAGWKKGDACRQDLVFYEGGTGKFKSTNLVSGNGTDVSATWEIVDGNIVNITYTTFSSYSFGIKANLDEKTLTRLSDPSFIYEKSSY